MKNSHITLFISCNLFAAFAAVPFRWTVETSRAVPAETTKSWARYPANLGWFPEVTIV